MDCDEVRRILDAYVDGELDLTRQLGVETHLPGCVTCKDAAEDIANFCSLVRMNAPFYKGPPELKAKIRAALRKESKSAFEKPFPITLSRWNAADRTTVISPMPNGAAWSRWFPPPNTAGVPPNHTRREILNGICYAIRSGGAWKLLPHDLPAWRTVYHYFWSWRRKGIWEQINDTVRGWVRQAAGRECQPSAAVLDSQSVRTTEQGGPRGYDGAKNLCGRKRHLLVDTLGLVLLVVVTEANVQDRDGARTLLSVLALNSGDCA